MQNDLLTQATVVRDLAAHMDRLRESAIQFHANFATGDRGFFSPSEEDAVLSLWVSYNKSRVALLELIDSLRESAGGVHEEAIVEFTIGYAAAITLVDAARFLRQLFGEDKIVRRKLNEPFDIYGIAEGSFDVVQASLTTPANAIGIHNANAFFDEHQEAIRSASNDEQPLQIVLDVIDRLGERTRVSKRKYVAARIDDRRRRLQQAIVSGGLSRAAYALQEWGSRLVSSMTTDPEHVPQLPDFVCKKLEETLQPGDVFVTRKEKALTNYFLPGYWPHAALYVGDGNVIESLKDGVRVRTLQSPFGNDAVCVIRPKLDGDLIQQAIERANQHVGKPYDFDFDFKRSDRLVCTEVVYRAYEGIAGIEFQLTKRAGRQNLSAEDLLNLARNEDPFELVAGFSPKHGNDLKTSDDLRTLLHDTMP